MAEFRDSVIFEVSIKNGPAVKALGQLQGSIDKLKKEQKQLSDALKEGRISQEKYNEENAKLKVQLKETRAEYRRVEKTVSSSTNSLNAQRQELIKLKRQLGRLDKGDASYASVEKQVLELNESLKESEAQYGVFSRNVGNYANSIISSFGKVGIDLGKLVSGPLAALGGAELLSKGIEAAIEYANELREVTLQTQQLTGETEGLDAAISIMQSTANSFGQDYSEVLRANNALAKRFGITQSEAAVIIQKSFVAAGSASNDLLGQLGEYAPILETIGLSAEESSSILIEGFRRGAFNDKFLDSLKESQERLTLMPKATREALDAIGVSSSELQKSIENGSITVFDAVSDILKEMGKLPPQSDEVKTALEQTFGTPGLDLNLPLLLELLEVDKSLDSIIDTSGDLVKQQQLLLDSQNQLNFAWNDFFNTGNGGFGDLIQNTQIFSNKVLGALLFKINQTTRSISRFFGFIREQDQGGDGGEVPPGQVEAIEKQTEEIKQKLQEQRKVYEDDLKKRLELLDRQESEARTRAINRSTERTINNADEKESEQQLQEDLFDIRLEFVQKRLNLEEKLKNETFKIREELANLLKEQAKKESDDELRERRSTIVIETIDTSPDSVAERFGLEQQQLSDHLDKIFEIRAANTDRILELDEKQLESIRLLDQQERFLADQRLALAGTVVSGIRQQLGLEEEDRKKFGAALKALSLAEIAINLQRELSSIAAAASANPANIITVGAAGVAQFNIQSAIAIARSAFAAATVLRQKFEYGGQVVGPSHSGGGVPIEVEGGEFVLRKSVVTPSTLPFLEAFNSGRFRPKFAEGGFVNSSVIPSFARTGASFDAVPRRGNSSGTDELAGKIAAALRASPPMVRVRDIIKEVDNVVEIENRAII